ncbi:MAG: wax ester/triacylglycerol synthase family O-acyltransferase [Rhizobacter sp.]|nr:wax ester/triacylglycerol synthase family O-acyltransferase [Rhizobacter sp.]
MKALSGVDGAFLHLETTQTPMHIASLHLLDPPARPGADFLVDVKRQMASRLHLAPVFTRKLASMPLQFANPVWVEEEQVDLDYHVQRVTLPSPGTQAQLEDCVGRLHSQLLDRSRPLWRLFIIGGLHSGQAGYYIKVHHAVVDGQAGVLLAQALFDVTPASRRIPRGVRPPAEHPGLVELAAAALKHDAGQYIKLVRHLPDVVKTLAGMFGAGSGQATGRLGQNFSFGPKTPINVPITGERRFAAVSVPLDTLKMLAAAHQAKLNDIVLALCSGALRRYLAQHGGIPKKPLIATMPISLREAGDREYTTQATLSLVNLNTQIADPVKRLRAIRDAAGAVKALAQRTKGVIPTDFPSIGLPWVLQGLASLYGRSGITRAMPPIANLVISNVPGPTQPLYVAGARMAAYWPLSIVEHGVGLNITVMSYAGAMGFGFTTARNAVPDARKLSAALLAALEELVAGGVPATPTKPAQPARPVARRRRPARA